MSRYIYLFFSFLLISCGGDKLEAIVEREDSSSVLLFEHVDIFTGLDSVLLRDHFVLVANGKIQTISQRPIDHPDAKKINGTGKTMLPGLIDAHVHLSGSGAVPWENIPANVEYNLQAYLYAGITTVYDLGGLSSDLKKLANAVATEEIVGPSIFHTHIPITIKNSHPIPLTEQMLPWPLNKFVNMISPTIDKPNEARELIGSYLKKDVDYVKIVCDEIPPGSPTMNYAQLKALVDEVHRQDKKAIVHIGSADNAIDAVQAGADVLAHGIWRGALTGAQADVLAHSNVSIIYTLAAMQNVKSIHNGTYKPGAMDRRLVPFKVIDPVTGENGRNVRQQPVMNMFFADVDLQSQYWEQNFQLLLGRGARILVGTDSSLPGTYAGSTYYQELEALSSYGMTNYQVLKAATFHNARAFLSNPDFGTVEEGKVADLLLVVGNPLQSLKVLRQPEMIISRGNAVRRTR